MSETVEEAVAGLSEALTSVEALHDEVTDTQVREEIADVLMRGFVQRERDYQVPPSFHMYTAAGDRAVREALETFFRQLGGTDHLQLTPVTRLGCIQPLAPFIGLYRQEADRG